MSGTHSHWIRVSHRRPCPVCSKPDWCLVSADGGAALCQRLEPGSVGRCGDAGWLHWLDGRVCRATLPPSLSGPKRDFASLALSLSQGADQPVRDLAAQLGVSTVSLQRLGVGWDHRDKWWSFPERDGQKQIVGILARHRDGTKRRLKGSRIGLSYPNDWSAGTGPVLLVEGPSDTAALLTLGLCVVGRPSNRGGGAWLADLLQEIPAEREIIVLGENDRKESGQWPGRDGAIATATDLALRLLRPIEWALPLDHAKDVRAWRNRFPQAPPQSLACVFLEGLDRQVIAPPPVIRSAPPVRPPVALGDYRQKMYQARLESLDRPGIYLDRSPTGSGKSQVDRQVISHMLQGGLAS